MNSFEVLTGYIGVHHIQVGTFGPTGSRLEVLVGIVGSLSKMKGLTASVPMCPRIKVLVFGACHFRHRDVASGPGLLSTKTL